MIYGYCRISTKHQNIERQERNIKEVFPEAVLVRETFTGTTTERPVWTNLAKKITTGDTVVFDSVSRMSRNADEGFELYQELYSRGVNLVFIKEPIINTETYKTALQRQIETTGNAIADEFIKATNNVLMILAKEQIRIAFEQAEKEVEDLHKRTREGIATAQLNGKVVGRPIGKTSETKKAIEMKSKIKKLSKDFDGELKDVEIIDILKIARNTYYKYKSELATTDGTC